MDTLLWYYTNSWQVLVSQQLVQCRTWEYLSRLCILVTLKSTGQYETLNGFFTHAWFGTSCIGYQGNNRSPSYVDLSFQNTFFKLHSLISPRSSAKNNDWEAVYQKLNFCLKAEILLLATNTVSGFLEVIVSRHSLSRKYCQIPKSTSS